jgi:hypothetical protein
MMLIDYHQLTLLSGCNRHFAIVKWYDVDVFDSPLFPLVGAGHRVVLFKRGFGARTPKASAYEFVFITLIPQLN